MLDLVYSIPPQSDEITWSNHLYQKAYKSQLERNRIDALSGIKPSRDEVFTVFPSCFFNPNWLMPFVFARTYYEMLNNQSSASNREIEFGASVPSLLPSLWSGPFAYHVHGEIWEKDGFASKDQNYIEMKRRIEKRMEIMIENQKKDVV